MLSANGQEFASKVLAACVISMIPLLFFNRWLGPETKSLSMAPGMRRIGKSTWGLVIVAIAEVGVVYWLLYAGHDVPPQAWWTSVAGVFLAVGFVLFDLTSP